MPFVWLKRAIRAFSRPGHPKPTRSTTAMSHGVVAFACGLVLSVGMTHAAEPATVVLDRAFVARVTPGTNGAVRATSVQSDGKIVVGGMFTSPSARLARYNADGTSDTTFKANVGTALNNLVVALSVQADSKIVVGGGFTSPSSGLARFKANGTPDTVFNASVGTTLIGQVNALTVQADGKIVVSGSFTVPSSRLARYNADGTPDTAFNANVGTILNNTAFATSVQADGKIVVGGALATPGGQLARFNADGTPDTAFNANVGTNLNNTAFATSVQADGKILVGGSFTSPSGRLARFNADGTPDTAFNANVGTGLTPMNVLTVSVQADGKILVGGSFTSPSGRLARFNADGTPDTVFNASVGSALNNQVFAASIQADGKIVVGGFFGGGLSRFMPACGGGIALTTSPTALWQQLALPCQPSSTSITVGGALGGNTTGQLDAANFSTRWVLWQRNAANSGNVVMASTDVIGVGTGHWIKSLDAPVGGLLRLDDTLARPTPLSTGVTGCQSTTEGCVVVLVPSATAGSRMIANPFPHDVDWSKVRVRVGGSTVYTPSQAAAANVNVLSNTVWIWNGNTYATWSDTGPTVGNLQYFKSFFVKVLPGGVGQTIDLLIPALGSTIASPAALMAAVPAVVPTQARATAAATAPTRPPVRPPSRSNDWVVDLGVQNLATGWSATAKLGQWAGAADGLDAGDLGAMAPFAQPYLTVVFPRPEWASDTADYTTDLRPAKGWAGKWDFEVRAQPLDSKVVLRWTAPAAVLAKSRLIDRDTGAVIYPTDPNYAGGYPMTLNTAVRRLTWEYLGN